MCVSLLIWVSHAAMNPRGLYHGKCCILAAFIIIGYGMISFFFIIAGNYALGKRVLQYGVFYFLPLTEPNYKFTMLPVKSQFMSAVLQFLQSAN